MVQVRMAGRGCREEGNRKVIIFYFTFKKLKILKRNKNAFELDKMYKPLARKIMKKDIKQQYQAQRGDITATHTDIEGARGNYRQV